MCVGYGQHKVRERESIALDCVADLDGNSPCQHRAGHHAGVELAVLAARIGARRQVGEQRVVETATGAAWSAPASDQAYHRIGGALARFPGAADRSPQGLVRRLAGKEYAVVERLHQYLAR